LLNKKLVKIADNSKAVASILGGFFVKRRKILGGFFVKKAQNFKTAFYENL
jgi:hypothetical protein